MNKNTAFHWFIILILLNIALAVYFYPAFPERVATHFSFTGQPNGWSSKSFYLWFQIGLTGFHFLLFWGLAALLPRLPDSAINIPHKNYWLDPERRDTALRKFQDLLYQTGSLTMLLFLVLHYDIAKNNMSDGQQFELPFWSILIGWLVLLIVMVIRGYRQFALPEKLANSEQ